MLKKAYEPQIDSGNFSIGGGHFQPTVMKFKLVLILDPPTMNCLLLISMMVAYSAAMSYQDILLRDLYNLASQDDVGGQDDIMFENRLDNRAGDWSGISYRDILGSAHIRDPEYEENSPVWGYQYMSGNVNSTNVPIGNMSFPFFVVIFNIVYTDVYDLSDCKKRLFLIKEYLFTHISDLNRGILRPHHIEKIRAVYLDTNSFHTIFIRMVLCTSVRPIILI